jgi:hypothetical protein
MRGISSGEYRSLLQNPDVDFYFDASILYYMSTPYSTSIVLATEDSQRSQKMSAQSTWVSCETTVSLSVHDCSHEPGPLTLGLITECDWEESTGLLRLGRIDRSPSVQFSSDIVQSRKQNPGIHALRHEFGTEFTDFDGFISEFHSLGTQHTKLNLD